jgi:diguanylate cyclase (GGDEF)-like protein/PAS domain S-box-containing protein
MAPAGHELSLMAYRSRHRALALLAAGEALAFAGLGLAGILGWAFGVAVPAMIGSLLLVGASTSAGRTTRALAVTLALLVGAVATLHAFEGDALGQLAVMVTIVLVALYQSWRPLLVSVATVIAHQSLVLAIWPTLAGSDERWAWVGGQVVVAVVLAMVTRVITRAADADRRLMLESGARPTYSVDERGVIQHANEAMAEMLGVSVCRLVGAVDHDLLHVGERATCEICSAVSTGRSVASLQLPLVGPGGDPFDAEVTVRPVNGPRRTLGATVTLADVSDRVAGQRRLEQVARTDSLTGLGNRFLLECDLGTVIGHEAELGRRVGMIHVDVDRFKPVNDTLGHAAGDRLLVVLAGRIQRAAPADALIARVGGDEFVVVVPDAIPEQVLACAEAMRASVAAPVELDGRVLSVTASLGVLTVSASRTSPAALVADVDLALQRAKRAGGNRVERFDLAMRAHADARVALVSDLHDALANGQFELHFQPAWDVHADQIDGCEALLRWNHPERGLVPPVAFVPLAEESGLIIELGRWVLAEALRRADGWLRDPTIPDLKVAVNVSAAQLRDSSLVTHVEDLLGGVSVPPQNLVLELTETMLMEDIDLTLPILHDLRALGVSLSIDDFGTGFSSLAMLRRLPVDEVKIDRQFLEAITTDQVGQRVVSSIIDLARALDLRVVAEGIESFEALEVARRLGADRAQGYALGRPLAASDFETRVRNVGLSRAWTAAARIA